MGPGRDTDIFTEARGPCLLRANAMPRRHLHHHRVRALVRRPPSRPSPDARRRHRAVKQRGSTDTLIPTPNYNEALRSPRRVRHSPTLAHMVRCMPLFVVLISVLTTCWPSTSSQGESETRSSNAHSLQRPMSRSRMAAAIRMRTGRGGERSDAGGADTAGTWTLCLRGWKGWWVGVRTQRALVPPLLSFPLMCFLAVPHV
ncbi:hypothetical protein F5148DRAFT_736343 [Russula earlei]|uniref:Uncharacterized protein n=1 Tax=Russula earlei TaxID=71964 RepID=A0ACC0TU23_9AGAM|nr:hypothetical protein F5148DRAFT_736343 [Russula earlei]